MGVVCNVPYRVVDVWIPSVIKSGRGPDSHHTYQIYLKIGGDEWNVYRRFSEFYEFHRQMSSQLVDINEYEFPKKKAMRSKVWIGL